jgi:hypothetical protein
MIGILFWIDIFSGNNSRLNGLSVGSLIFSSHFDRIVLDRKCLAWLAFGAISGGWRGTWSGLDGRVRIWACLA